MADDTFIRTPAGAARGGLRARAVLGTALLAFLLGGGAVGYAMWQGLIPLSAGPARTVLAEPGKPAAVLPPVPARPDALVVAAQQEALEARAAALAQRLDSLDLTARAAAGNAARSEALLVAFAARRALDRGAPLGLLEDQLRLRFGNAQPNAVATVISAAREPITLDQLVAGLDALAPALTAAPATAGTWERFKQELAGLFVIRRQSAPTPEPQTVLRRARILLEEGRSDDAMNEVRRLPGARGAGDWLAAVRRYDSARRALDVLETTALIEPAGLRDPKAGQAVPGPATPASPAVTPASGAAPAT